MLQDELWNGTVAQMWHAIVVRWNVASCMVALTYLTMYIIEKNMCIIYVGVMHELACV